MLVQIVEIFLLFNNFISKTFYLAYALRLCTNESVWEEKADYSLCIGCSSDEIPNSVCIKKNFRIIK
jgi:hypothetical protein